MLNGSCGEIHGARSGGATQMKRQHRGDHRDRRGGESSSQVVVPDLAKITSLWRSRLRRSSRPISNAHVFFIAQGRIWWCTRHEACGLDALLQELAIRDCYYVSVHHQMRPWAMRRT